MFTGTVTGTVKFLLYGTYPCEVTYHADVRDGTVWDAIEVQVHEMGLNIADDARWEIHYLNQFNDAVDRDVERTIREELSMDNLHTFQPSA